MSSKVCNILNKGDKAIARFRDLKSGEEVQCQSGVRWIGWPDTKCAKNTRMQVPQPPITGNSSCVQQLPKLHLPESSSLCFRTSKHLVGWIHFRSTNPTCNCKRGLSPSLDSILSALTFLWYQQCKCESLCSLWHKWKIDLDNVNAKNGIWWRI